MATGGYWDRFHRRRMSRRRLLRALAVSAAALVASGGNPRRLSAAWDSGPRSVYTATDAGAPELLTKTLTPIKHFVMLMQENHTFDNYFGKYPGVDGIPDDVRMPMDPDDPRSPLVTPFHIGDSDVQMDDPDHSSRTHRLQYNEGRMDGFVRALNMVNQDGRLAMGYYDDRDLPFYWNVADRYVLFQRFFSSAATSSFVNHIFWATATAGLDERDLDPQGPGLGDIPTIFDLLRERGISWKFYVQNYDPTITYRHPVEGPRSSQLIWVPLLNYGRYLDDPELFSRIVDVDEYFEDLKRGTLPSVAFMVPSGPSEHPPAHPLSGQRFVRSLISELMRNDAWYSTAFMWTYDDWGGWYDHVPPPQVDEHGYGFRVPALLVSPFARQGYVDSTQLDFTSGLKFIEENWSLEPLAERDAHANNLLDAFDFSQNPHEPHFIPWARETAEPQKEKRSNRKIIYTAYGSALAVSGLLAVGAKLSGKSAREPMQPAESQVPPADESEP